jgi:hypothetical protein
MFDGVAALYFLLKIILANAMTLEMDTAPWDASLLCSCILQACAKPLSDVSRLASDLFSALKFNPSHRIPAQNCLAAHSSPFDPIDLQWPTIMRPFCSRNATI